MHFANYIITQLGNPDMTSYRELPVDRHLEVCHFKGMISLNAGKIATYQIDSNTIYKSGSPLIKREILLSSEPSYVFFCICGKYMSCISKTACFSVNCASLSLQYGWIKEPNRLEAASSIGAR